MGEESGDDDDMGDDDDSDDDGDDMGDGDVIMGIIWWSSLTIALLVVLL